MSSTARWAKEIKRLLSIRSQFVLSGNINDLYIYTDEESQKSEVLPIEMLIWNLLQQNGFECIIRYNPVNGISFYPDQEKRLVADGLELSKGEKPSLCDLANYLEQIVLQRDDGQGEHQKFRVAVLIDYASRISREADSLSDEEHDFFRRCDKLAKDATAIYRKETSDRFFNPIIWCALNRYDLPVWYGMDSNRVVYQDIERPINDARRIMADIYLREISDYSTYADNIETYIKLFADLSEGLTLKDMLDIVMLANAQKMGIDDIDDAVRGYKTGNQDINSPWKGSGLRDRIRDAHERITTRVKGQKPALELSLDILKRSIMGLTGAHTSSAGSRPRGVLFLAGPTGTGKTELAKALTESIFGTEDAYIRFDMSEFSSEHSDARLLGAPPGYVGFESGGELTKAIKAKPFSLVLFDEIEKANPRILDKFLQILEDGRLTDGQGETVYFSESIIVFTSNLGIVKRDENGRPEQLVQPGEPYEDIRTKVLEGIRHHFTFVLGRPEILNRLGDNVVVFNFIQSDVAIDIFDLMIRNVEKRVLQEHGSELVITKNARDKLVGWCTEDLRNGGRGIGSKLEGVFVNPLARALFERSDLIGKKVQIDDIKEVDHVFSVIIPE